MIGTGVFTSLGYQTGSIPSWFSIMVLWFLGALISLFGALVYSEIATRIKKSGGEYTYLSEIYYPWLGFIAGWISFIVGFAAPIAAVAIAIGSYTSDIFNISYDIIASLVIIFIGTIHLFGIKTGGWFQNIATRFKILLILIMIVLPFILMLSGDFSRSSIVFNPFNNGVNDFKLIFSSEFAISLVYVCFAYSGWNASIYFSEKIENPRRNIPFSLIIGTLFVSILYLALNSLNYLLEEKQENYLFEIRKKETKINKLDRVLLEERSEKWKIINLTVPLLYVLIIFLTSIYLRRMKYNLT